MIHFGTLRDGRVVHALDLSSSSLSVRILTYGAILNRVHLDGVERNLTLGSERLADYEQDIPYHGTLIGPVVNRLTGAQAPIGGKMHPFEANQDARLTLHSGSAYTGAKVWDVSDHGTDCAVLALDMPHGEGGFPGNRRIEARFEVDGANLRMTLTGSTDAPTLMNFANHSYWSLDGGESYAGHSLKIAADRYLPTTTDFAPTGEIATVDGTPMDLRVARAIAPNSPPLDNCYCLADADRALTDVLWLRGQSGVEMTLATTAPGVQVFDNRPDYRGIAIEAQGWPDAPNHAGFPPIEMHSQDRYHQVTEWRFAQ